MVVYYACVSRNVSRVWVLALLLAGCADGVFSIAVLPDTQCYSLHFPEIFDAQGRWVEENRRPLDIRGVVHLGDVTEHNDPAQWEIARRALGPLLEYVPLAVAPGNHDLGERGAALDRSSSFDAFFPIAERAASPGFLGSYPDDAHNTLWAVRGGCGEFLLLSLEFSPRPEVLAWARAVAAAHPDEIIILSTHAYLDGEGARYDHLDLSAQPFCPYEYGVTAAGGSDGEEIWAGLVAVVPNIRIVLSGHVPNGFAYTVDTNDAGLSVHQIMVDYQTGTVCPVAGGDGRGYLLLMEFDACRPSVEVHVRSYSPWDDAYRDDHEIAFEIER